MSRVATDLKPITDLLKKTAWSWGPAEPKAFKTIREKLASSEALDFYSPNKKTVLSADSSNYGLGATLMQWDRDRLIQITYASRTLTDAERRSGQECE